MSRHPYSLRIWINERYQNMRDISESPARASDKMGTKKRSSAAAGRPGTVAPTKGLVGSQTLTRGLDVLEAVAAGATNLAALAEALDLNRSTTHRLAGTLVGRRYLSFAPRVGYALGPKLLELGFQARAQMSLQRVAREHIEALA